MKTENNFQELSQSISELNLLTQNFTKFNHTWNQTILSIENPSTRSRSMQIVKNIKEQLLKFSSNQDSPEHSYFPGIIDSHPSSTASKKSNSPSIIKKKSLPFRLIRQNTLIANFAEMDSLIHEKKFDFVKDLIKGKSSDCKIKQGEDAKELFSLNNALSESTLVKIREMQNKVSTFKKLLTMNPVGEVKIPEIAAKKAMAFRKIRATQYIRNKNTFIARKPKNTMSFTTKTNNN